MSLANLSGCGIMAMKLDVCVNPYPPKRIKKLGGVASFSSARTNTYLLTAAEHTCSINPLRRARTLP